MALTGEEENFVKVTKIVVDVIPKYLRKCFIAKWNDKYNKQYNKPWSSDNAIGTFLFSELPTAVQNNKKREKEIEKLKEGDEKTWDTTTVVFALVEAGLNLIAGSRPKGNRPGQLRISEEIEVIRDVRNSFFGHVPNMQCSSADFTDIVAKVKAVAKNIFGQDAEDEIDNVVKSQIKSRLSVALQHQLDVEINRNRDFNELVCEIEKMKEEFHKMEGKMKKLEVEQDKLEKEIEGVVGNVEAQIGKVKGDVGNLNVKVEKLTENLPCSKLPPYTDKDIDQLKRTYKVQYQKHNIHKVYSNDRIVMEAVNVNDFAVKLKISETRPADATFKDETRRYFENLKGKTGKDIELNDLLNDHDKRIILVNGIAAIGKSVLMKQLAFSWANNEMYTQFNLCIIMECREINSFRAKEGAHLKKHELFSEFLKTKFEYDLKGGVSTLILLDGLDELWDIGTGDSMIWELLDVKNTKYAMAKIILTGRPHVEGKLDRSDKDTGGIKRFEIQGLNDEQRRNYITKIASCEKDIANINRTIDSSEKCSQVSSIPGFLNMLSCVAMISGGETLKSLAELYVWLLYLLLKEHVQKKGPNQKLCFEIFNEYSSELEALCEICHQLLNKNEIIFEGDIKSRLLKCGKGAEFIDGLFADISGCRTKKYQFKHLTIMEILSAIHISRRKDRMEIIEHNLKTEFYQVVIFSCQLIGGYKYDGIIKDMFGNDEELKGINVEQFLPKVLELVGQCINHELKVHQQQQQLRHLFRLSIDIIMCFINKDVSNKNFIISTVKTLRYKMSELEWGSMRKVSELCGHLSSAFKCNEEDLKEAFENFLVKRVIVVDVKTLACVKYLRNVEEFWLVGRKIKINSFRIRSEANAVAKCKDVMIWNCEFTDDGIMENNMAIKDQKMNRLELTECKLNKYSFINVCNWALEASVNTFELFSVNNIEHSWWGEIAAAIQNAKEKNNGILALRELHTFDCTQNMSREVQMKIVQCGVQLEINGRRIEHPLQSDSSSSSNYSLSESSSHEPLVLLSTLTSSSSTITRPQQVALPSSSTSSISTSARPPQAVAPPGVLNPSTSDGSHDPQFTDNIEEWVVIDVCNADNGRNVSCSTYRGDDNKESPQTSTHSETVITDYHSEGHSPQHCMLL